MSDDRDVAATVAAIHDHLQATEELPLEERANRWLGEAQAVAADIAHGSPSREVVARRADQIVHLLEQVDGTGDERADEHVATARSQARALVAHLDGPTE
jgi:1,2-phenylacetyl-CoA epoxidase catalytic subunit